MMNKEVYFKNQDWCICIKKVNTRNFTITYEEKGGYRSKESAIMAKEKYDLTYKEDIKKIKEMTNIRFTFKEYLKYWLEEYLYNSTDTSTRMLGKWTVENLILPNVHHDILLGYVTVDYLNGIIDRSKAACQSAGQMSYKYMRSILKTAFTFGYISTDLHNQLEPVRREIPRIYVMNKQELKALLETCSKHPAGYFEILLAVFVGLRSGEIRGLKYSDFNEKEKTVRISRQYTTNYTLAESDDSYIFKATLEEKAPKACSYRTLKIPDFIFEELKKRKKLNKEVIKKLKNKGKSDLDEQYVSISFYGKRKSKGAYLTYLKRMCVIAGIPAVSMHSLRHLFATMLLESGMNLEYISRLMGHRSPITTFTIYCGVYEAGNETKEVLDHFMPFNSQGRRCSDV